MKRLPIIVVPIVLVAIICVHFWGAQLGIVALIVERMAPGFISTSSWVRALEGETTDRTYDVYYVLRERGTDAAIDRALKHLESDDAYLWLNAAIYLGSQGRAEAVPYLIKSKRHTAWRSVDERVMDLQVITGQNIDVDFAQWREWYLSTDPKFVPDWDSSLGHSPRR